jgi:ribosome silencing factor RsfS/YbeB/iojap
MDIKKLQTAVVDALEDVKAQDIKIFDTTHLTSLFDRVAVASGTSNRQTKALAASVRDKVKSKGGQVISVEGEDTGEWVLVDLGDMIVHIMQPAIRAYYRLEEIWGEKEVKLGAAKRVASTAAAKREASEAAPVKIRRTKAQAEAVEASQAIDDDEPKKPARKPRAGTGSPYHTCSARFGNGRQDSCSRNRCRQEKSPGQESRRQDHQGGGTEERQRSSQGTCQACPARQGINSGHVSHAAHHYRRRPQDAELDRIGF